MNKLIIIGVLLLTVLTGSMFMMKISTIEGNSLGVLDLERWCKRKYFATKNIFLCNRFQQNYL